MTAPRMSWRVALGTSIALALSLSVPAAAEEEGFLDPDPASVIQLVGAEMETQCGLRIVDNLLGREHQVPPTVAIVFAPLPEAPSAFVVEASHPEEGCHTWSQAVVAKFDLDPCQAVAGKWPLDLLTGVDARDTIGNDDLPAVETGL